MNDIAKCMGQDCEKRESCWRYVAPPAKNQFWLEPIFNGDGECISCWPMDEDGL